MAISSQEMQRGACLQVCVAALPASLTKLLFIYGCAVLGYCICEIIMQNVWRNRKCCTISWISYIMFIRDHTYSLKSCYMIYDLKKLYVRQTSVSNTPLEPTRPHCAHPSQSNQSAAACMKSVSSTKRLRHDFYLPHFLHLVPDVTPH